MKSKSLKQLLPEFPRTIHLPWKPNAVQNDVIAVGTDADLIFTTPHTYVEEKVDGANCAMMFYEGEAVIRNRSHILNKGYLKDTPAKIQFRSAWTWFYENKKKFDVINNIAGRQVGVYGEWLLALHGIEYDKLPTLFMAYDVFDCEAGNFLDIDFARLLLEKSGFIMTPLLHKGPVKDWEQLENWCNEPTTFSSTDLREGVYVKVSTDQQFVTHRFKMIRSGFVQGSKWDEEKMTKNKLAGKNG